MIDERLAALTAFGWTLGWEEWLQSLPLSIGQVMSTHDQGVYRVCEQALDSAAFVRGHDAGLRISKNAPCTEHNTCCSHSIYYPVKMCYHKNKNYGGGHHDWV